MVGTEKTARKVVESSRLSFGIELTELLLLLLTVEKRKRWIDDPSSDEMIERRLIVADRRIRTWTH
jgi:hypothetical protein